MRYPAPRLLILGLGALLLVFAYQEGARSQRDAVRAAPQAEAQPEAQQAGTETDYAADYAAFVSALGLYRSGDDTQLADLRRTAQRLDELHDRDDAPQVAEYYASLTSAERSQGLTDYQRFVELWGAVQAADAATWPQRRPAQLAELRSFIAQVAAHADFVPAGRALALAAHIEVQALHSGMGLFEREDWSEVAERDAREALAIFERAGMQTPRLEPLWILAELAQLAGEQRAAEDGFEAVLDVAELCRIDDYRERALLGLVNLARERGDAVHVDRLLGELASFRRPEDCWPLAREHANRLLNDDQPVRAAEFLLRVRPLDSHYRKSWTQFLALTRLRQGDLLGARALLDRLGPDTGDEELIVARARVALSEGATRDVLESLTHASVARFSARTRQFAHSLRGEALLLQQEPAAALVELKIAREIAQTWELRLQDQRSLEGTSATVFGEWLGLHSAALEARALAAEGRGLEAAFAIEQAQSPRWRAAAGRAASVADLERWAAHYEHGLVTWIFGADVGLVVHVDRSGLTTSLEIDRTRKQITRAVRRFREALIGGDEARALSLSEDLSTTLFPPELLTQLASGRPEQRLLCVAHGALEVLPFEALVWSGRSIDRYATSLVLPELRDLAPGEVQSDSLAWNLLGDPLAQDGSVLLPAAARELDAVQALWSEATRSSAAEFTREACAKALSGPHPVHIATHLARDERCGTRGYSAVGLEMSNGEVLCAAELAQQDISAPLVVLSACDTAGGRFVDARGRQGLARALLDGGARDLLVTLWPVTDEAAREFTPRFHSALRDGLSPSCAARRARLELADAGADPADWAAFRIAGRD